MGVHGIDGSGGVGRGKERKFIDATQSREMKE